MNNKVIMQVTCERSRWYDKVILYRIPPFHGEDISESLQI